MSQEGVKGEVKNLRPARARRGRLPDRSEVVVHAALDPGDKYVVCNTDEGEPGTFKDRDIMRFPTPAFGHRGHGDRRLRHGCQPRLQLRSW